MGWVVVVCVWGGGGERLFPRPLGLSADSVGTTGSFRQQEHLQGEVCPHPRTCDGRQVEDDPLQRLRRAGLLLPRLAHRSANAVFDGLMVHVQGGEGRRRPQGNAQRWDQPCIW